MPPDSGPEGIDAADCAETARKLALYWMRDPRPRWSGTPSSPRLGRAARRICSGKNLALLVAAL
ncbi:hypothetical protein PG990_013059 [Apiospora arundinis]|uniref:Uncharacterized protein n=1 Tax=Apiospora arundinis TaxID=335852 RepID=A0ABR2HSE9_9PEZI